MGMIIQHLNNDCRASGPNLVKVRYNNIFHMVGISPWFVALTHPLLKIGSFHSLAYHHLLQNLLHTSRSDRDRAFPENK